ncbi:MAG: O-antigen ligase family protein [Bacteroidetes bacterium]|nr:O-antigen ligase family protein [Bacteroidota bacterium]
MTIFLVPLSANLDNIGMGVGVAIPTDPILFGLLLFTIIKTIYDGGFDKQVLLHPVSIFLSIQLAWVFITALTSSMHIISFKYLISQMWFITTFYFIATQVFKKIKNIQHFFWLYIIPFCGIIAYTLINHSQHGFDQQSGNWVMKPFYNDHTSYGAALALFIPFVIAKTFENNNKTAIIKPIIFGVLLYLILATLLSYTRAAWISLIGGWAVYLILKFKIKWQILFMGVVIAAISALVMQDDIRDYFSKNKVNSSTDINQHVKSMSNVTSDASNKERINRWKSAYAMFKERPVFGWGPATYSFNYGSFQKESDKTIISTNAGDMGNAHSEYMGPLSESGLLGLLIVLGLFVTILITGVRVYKRSESKFFRMYSMCCLVGLTTYMIHGFLNNFLDTDKITAPFYGMTAILVVMDLYNQKKYSPKELEEQLEEL